MVFTKVELTDAEWMSLIDGSHDSDRPGSLMACCANISELRDSIISLARNGGVVNPFDERKLKQTLGWVLGGHDVEEIPALVKLAAALDVEIESLPHEARRIEL